MTEKYLLNQLIAQLEQQGTYLALAEALQKQNLCFPVLKCEKATSVCFQIREGESIKHVEKQVDTAFHAYLNQVVIPIVEAYKLENPNHCFDDKKFRLDKFDATNLQDKHTLTLWLAPIAYQQFQTDLTRPKSEALELILKGLQTHQDPYAYFSKILGVTIIPISKEGFIFLGERVQSIDYQGLLSFVSGSIDFCENVSHLNLSYQALKEIKEEINYEAYAQNLCFIGIAANALTSEMDIIFTLQTDLSRENFRHLALSEHTNLICLENKQDLKKLLEQPERLMYATQFGLEFFYDMF